VAKKGQEAIGLLDEDRRGRRASQGRDIHVGNRAWKGDVVDRILVAKKLPQAVLKISSHNTGAKSVAARLHYISRQGTISLETDEGVMLVGSEEVDELVSHWAVDFPERKNSRDSMSLVISLPAGTNERAAIDAAREFFAETFAENHEYVFAGHDDTDNFHIHLVVKARGRDGKPMRPSRRDPQLWRQRFAEKARAHGIELDASPRFARGQGRRTPPTSVYEIRRRREIPRVDESAAKEAIRRATNPRDRASRSESVIRKINQRERVIFATQAMEVVAQAKKLKDDGKRMMALEIASELASFAEGMPVPRSRMDTMKSALKPELGQPKVDVREVHKLVKFVERGIRDQVSGFESRSDQRRVIAARVRLSNVIKERDRSRGQSRDASQDRDIER